MAGQRVATRAGSVGGDPPGNCLRDRLSRLLRRVVEGRFPPPAAGGGGAGQRRHDALVLIVEDRGAGEVVDGRRTVALRRYLLEPGEQLLLGDGVEDLVGPFE